MTPWVRCLLGAVAVSALGSGAIAGEPKPGGTLIFGVEAEPPNYDCHANTSFAFIHPVRPHYSTLLKFDPAHYPAVIGDLAESWSVSADQKTYSFTLKPNVTFHDGSPLTSEDVKASYERIIHPSQGVVSARAATYEDIVAIETPTPLSLVFRLGAPNPAMPTLLASPWNCIYSAAKLRQDPKWPEQHILGSGPFRFVQHIAGAEWRGARFAGYFEPHKPYLDGYQALFIKGAAAINALQAGQILAEFRGQSPVDRDKLVAALGDKVVVQQSPWVCNLVVAFNTKRKPFDDRRVRRALSLAIDRWNSAVPLSKITFIGPVGGVLRPGYEFAAKPAELEQLPGFSHDIAASRAEAKQLLKEAGVPALTLKLTNRNIDAPYTPVGVLLIDQWRRIGVAAEHQQLETQLYQAALRSGNYDAAIDFSCDFTDEPDLQLAKYISADRSPVNYGGYIDRTLDELYEKQKRATDPYRALRPGAPVRKPRAERGLYGDDLLVAAHHRACGAAERLAHHAQPLRQPGPRRRLARSVSPAWIASLRSQ
ncbi:MAG: ABC transporter substrate-binding protein [Pseudomonadota bacterium]